MNYSNYRKSNHKDKKKRTRAQNADMDDWRREPYTALKSRLFFEITTPIVYFLQFTPIKANWISLTYSALQERGGSFNKRSNSFFILRKAMCILL